MLVSETYPYPEAPDIETSSASYETRFSGPVGEWFISTQTDALLQIIDHNSCESVLDVGGGHAQTAIPLINMGFDVTVLGSAPECSRKLSSMIDAGKCKFQVGSVIKLPYPDKAFDAVIAFRLVSHIENWSLLIAELCRVSRSQVIIDFPQRLSFNALMPLLFGTKKKYEKNTRHYLMFSKTEIRREFVKNGFVVSNHVPQFFFPMVLHRFLRNPSISTILEKTSRLLGLQKLFGSPIVAGFTRV